MRLLSGLGRETPTETLLMKTESLSVQQMIAFHTLMMVKKVTKSQQPKYLAEKLSLIEDVPERRVMERTKQIIIPVERNLSVSRGGFVYRGYKLFNSLPVSLRSEQKIPAFRKNAKAWVKFNIDSKLGLKS